MANTENSAKHQPEKALLEESVTNLLFMERLLQQKQKPKEIQRLLTDDCKGSKEKRQFCNVRLQIK